MDMKEKHNSSVLTDSAPVNNSRLGIYTALLPYSPSGAVVLSRSLFSTIPRQKSLSLDDVLSTRWLDSMKSTSPTRNNKTNIKDSTTSQIPPSTNHDRDVAYHIWMLKYPSALSSFEQITNYAKGKKIALFLDYDGTLSPIVDNPDRAFMSSAMRAAVRTVAKYFPTAIISGRSRDKVFKFVRLKELYYAGSHGMDIMCPVLRTSKDDVANCINSTSNQGKEVNVFQPASEFFPMINEVYRTLVEITKEIEGAKVENNKFCVSVHYRNVDEKNWTTVAKRVHDTLKHYPSLRLTHGRKVLEVRPVLNWDKGKAVEFLLESLGLNSCDNVLPIYIGDDRTDEDAFKFLREGNRGYGILVSSEPKESSAVYSLRDPNEVLELLKSLVVWKKKSSQV